MPCVLAGTQALPQIPLLAHTTPPHLRTCGTRVRPTTWVRGWLYQVNIHRITSRWQTHPLCVFRRHPAWVNIKKKFRPKQSIGHTLMPWLSSQFFLFFLHWLFSFGLNCGHGHWVCMGVFFSKVLGASVSLLWQWRSLHKHCWCAYDNTWSHQHRVAVALLPTLSLWFCPAPFAQVEKEFYPLLQLYCGMFFL